MLSVYYNQWENGATGDTCTYYWPVKWANEHDACFQTKEEVAPTLEAVQNIQTISQALQKSKENYNAKTVEQERLRKEGATQRDVDKVGGHDSVHTHPHEASWAAWTLQKP